MGSYLSIFGKKFLGLTLACMLQCHHVSAEFMLLIPYVLRYLIGIQLDLNLGMYVTLASFSICPNLRNVHNWCIICIVPIYLLPI